MVVQPKKQPEDSPLLCSLGDKRLACSGPLRAKLSKFPSWPTLYPDVSSIPEILRFTADEVKAFCGKCQGAVVETGLGLLRKWSSAQELWLMSTYLVY